MMQNSRNTFIHIQQNIFALKALFYIQQLYTLCSFKELYLFNFKEMIYLLTIKETNSFKDLFTKSIIIRGNYIRSRNYINFKELISSMKLYSFKENITFREIISIQGIYSFKEHNYIRSRSYVH